VYALVLDQEWSEKLSGLQRKARGGWHILYYAVAYEAGRDANGDNCWCNFIAQSSTECNFPKYSPEL
jgi:hypothetical protein